MLVENLHGITPAEAIARLNAMEPGTDNEGAHAEADLILRQVLTHFGAYEVAEAWEEARHRVNFWYA